MALGSHRVCYCWAAALLLSFCTPAVNAEAVPIPAASILVVGSLNIDIIIPIERLPTRGETITARSPSTEITVGGKGANQAIAAARLAASTGRETQFVCRFGNDGHAAMLETELVKSGVDVSGCKRAKNLPSGQGIVMLETDGTASSIVLSGANTAWTEGTEGNGGKVGGNSAIQKLMQGVGAVMLQREVPEHVNLAVAQAAAKAGVPVLQDVGGEDRPISDEMLRLVDYLSPNESELQRLTGMPTSNEDEVIAAATSLTTCGARNVLITLAERGALLVRSNGSVVRQAALPVPGGVVVDGTAAGDAFRAGFAVALVEGWPLQECLQYAAAAGAVAVSRMGAAPSLPTREEALALLPPELAQAAAVKAVAPPASPAEQRNACGVDAAASTCSADGFPYKFASRLNSMLARQDLLVGGAEKQEGIFGLIARQGRVKGLELIDFNYPQHLEGLTEDKVSAALTEAGLKAGAICIRFPAKFSVGAFSNPDEKVRAEAIAIAVDGCRWAGDLGARDLIVWSPYDGYDYHFQVDYIAAWQRTVDAFQRLADSCPQGVRVSLEFKPTDESTRFSIVPTTGAALMLVRDVHRQNFGVTLDVGHLLMAGENPAQSVAMVGSAGKLFGMQLNDAHVKLGAEDGLAFGAINPIMALELVHWLKKVKYDGHIYYDTFPKNEDPVREAEYNIRRFKALWARAERLAAAGIEGFAAIHDAMGVMELLEADEERKLLCDATMLN